MTKLPKKKKSFSVIGLPGMRLRTIFSSDDAIVEAKGSPKKTMKLRQKIDISHQRPKALFLFILFFLKRKKREREKKTFNEECQYNNTCNYIPIEQNNIQ